MYKSFKSLDKNSDGKLCKQELIEGYQMIYKHLSEEEVVKQVDEFFKVADADANGEIDYLEWQVATISKFGVLSDEKLREAFKLFDRVSFKLLTYNFIGW